MGPRSWPGKYLTQMGIKPLVTALANRLRWTMLKTDWLMPGLPMERNHRALYL